MFTTSTINWCRQRIGIGGLTRYAYNSVGRLTRTTFYLYGHDCLGQYDDAADEWLYYLNDATGYVRQGADEQGAVTSHWLFDPDGTLLEGPKGPVSHLICGGVYDWSTGLIFKGGRYFDPSLGIWLMLLPLMLFGGWISSEEKKRQWWLRWALWLLIVLIVVMVAGCACNSNPPPPPSQCTPTMPTTGAEPPYDPTFWDDNGPIQNSNNCYSYGADNPYGHYYGCKPQPGLASGMGGPRWPVTCADVAARAENDGFVVSDCDLPCSPGFYKLALVTDEILTGRDDSDYHWYRQDQGGCWSHKRGHSPVSNVDASGDFIADPRLADRNYGPIAGGGDLNYHQFCGCFCVPQGGIRTACP